MDTQGGTRPAWLDDPLLRATYPPREIEQHWGDPLKKMTPAEVARARRNFESDARNAMKLRAAGIRIVNGTTRARRGSGLVISTTWIWRAWWQWA